MGTTQWESLIRNDVYDRFLPDRIYSRDHSIRVYKAAKSRGLSEACCIAALLHDVVEDSEYSLDHLRKLYSKCPYIKPALKLVEVLTRNSDETYMAYIRRVAQNPKARLIKILDIEDNLFSTLMDGGYCSRSLAGRYIRALEYFVKDKYDEKEEVNDGQTSEGGM